MKTILITGGTGLIGRHLCIKLVEKGYDVVLLSRNRNRANSYPVYNWDPGKNEIENEAIAMADYIIHLAGAGIGDKRWTKKRKKLIADSRIKTTGLLFDRVNKSGSKIKAFISASGISYYGTITSDKVFVESDPPANDFLGKVCQNWEQMAGKFEVSGIRTVKIRTGIVLAKKSGVLARTVIPARFGIGSALGNGKQYMPWIHIDDLCDIYIKAIEDSKMTGAYNAVAPGHITNRVFMSTTAKVLGKPFFFPAVPSFLMKMLFGQMSEIILYGSRVSAEKIISAGYSFKFPDLENALKNLLSNR